MNVVQLLQQSFSPGQCEVLPATAVDAIDGVQPSCAAIPSSVEAVAELVRLASRERLKILSVGGRQHLHLGNAPARADILLSAARLNQIAHYEPEDLTASAGAGVSLGQLGALTRPRRQFLPLDPSGGDRATLGGVISANVFGHLRTQYGTARDYIVGARFIRGDGTLIKSGGRVVKNVAGYDLHKLLVGAHGTLGVVTEVSLKLRPMPESELTALCCVSYENLPRLLSGLAHSSLLPMRAAVLNREAAREVMPDFTAAECAVLVSFGDTAASNRSQTERLQTLCKAAGASAADLLSDEMAAGAWRLLREIDSLLESSIALRISVLPSASAESVRWLGSQRMPASLCMAIVAMPLAGVIWVNVRAGLPPGFIDALRETVRASRGSVVVERAPAELKWTRNVWGDVGTAAVLMRSIREMFDPYGIFCPERFVV